MDEHMIVNVGNFPISGVWEVVYQIRVRSIKIRVGGRCTKNLNHAKVIGRSNKSSIIKETPNLDILMIYSLKSYITMSKHHIGFVQIQSCAISIPYTALIPLTSIICQID